MSEDQTNLTLRQRKRMQQSAGSSVGSGSEPKSKRYLRVLLAVGLILVLGVGVWAWMHFNRGNDPRYQEVLALQAKANKLDNPISPEAIDLYKQMHEKMKGLPDDLKEQVQQNGINSMQMRSTRFFASSSKDQLALLDMFILAVQAKQLKDSLTGQTPSTGADSGKADGDSGKAAGGSGNAPAGHGWGGTDAQKMQHMQKMLSNLTPQQRAQWGMGRQMFNARMQQQGGTPPPGGIF